MAEDAGLDTTRIGTDTVPINNWFLILNFADLQGGKVEDLVQVALRDYPDNDALQRAAAGAPPPLLAGPEPADWRGARGAQLERIIGSESSLVPIAYLEIGMDRARAVAKVLRGDGGSGTGFLIPGGLLVTNNHVLPNADVARTATALFNYQETPAGLSAPVDTRGLLPDERFETSVENDWSAVRVAGDPHDTWGNCAWKPRP